MCQVCKIEGVDWKFHNGDKRPLCRATFYRVYVGEVKAVSLCYLHSLELFTIGESRFLEAHPGLALEFSKKSTSSSASDDFSFDFA